jgi:aspartate--tRNA ligase
VAHKDERGTVSAVGLAVLTVILLLGLAAAAFMRNGADLAVEYEREMQLRLAAESAVETAAAKLERDASAYGVPPARNQRKRITEEVLKENVPVGADIELHVVLEGSDAREPENVLKVTAAAIDKSGMRIPDGENWERAKIVRARMEKKEKDNRYVWQRWY